MAAATAAAALKLARAELGNVGGSKFKALFKAPANAAWCAYFVCWVLAEAGIHVLATGWTPNIVTWAKKNDRWKTSNPKRGDLVLFMWATVSSGGRGTPPVCHVGIVEAVNKDGSITTIEGNTSAIVGGSQYNGNVCARKVRRGSIIQGYVDMSGLYGKAAAKPKPKPTPSSKPSGGATPVRALQKAVGATVDGIWGRDTDKRLETVKAAADFHGGEFPHGVTYAQKVVGTKADGVWGRKSSAAHDKTVEAIQKALGVEVDGIWGAETDAAYKAARAAHKEG